MQCLNLRLEHSTYGNKKKCAHADKNITNSEESKKIRRGLEDVFSSEFKKIHHLKKIRNLSNRERARRVLPIAYQVLAVVTDINVFEQN